MTLALKHENALTALKVSILFVEVVCRILLKNINKSCIDNENSGNSKSSCHSLFAFEDQIFILRNKIISCSYCVIGNPSHVP